MTSAVISLEESVLFARLSGDFNCQHLDPVRARRLPFGRTVVHGLHTVLLSLDHLARVKTVPISLATIRASFSAPIFQGTEFDIEIVDRGAKIAITVRTAQTVACTLSIELDETGGSEVAVAVRQDYGFSDAVELNAEDMPGAAGQITLTTEPALVSTLFPDLARLLDPDQIAVALATTRLVGMHCTGERSIFKFLSLAFRPGERSPDLTYKVDRFEARSGLASISLAGSWITGSIHAVLRARPVPQDSFASIRERIPDGRFAGRSVLVAGGSRGLGEIAAKAAAAGGAEVVVGYALGADDARRVADEIVAGGGNARPLHLDVLADDLQLTGLQPKSISHIYYFSSPKITFNDKREVDLPLLYKYIGYYVVGLQKIISALISQDLLADEVDIFAPSSAFVEDNKSGAFEYAAAKAAAETYAIYCAGKYGKNIEFLTPRLPMLLTDQTSTVDEKLPDASTTVIAELLALR